MGNKDVSRLRSLCTNLIGLAEVFLQSGQRLLEVHLLPAELVSLGLEHVLPLLLLVEALVVVVDVGPETNYPVFNKDMLRAVFNAALRL